MNDMEEEIRLWPYALPATTRWDYRSPFLTEAVYAPFPPKRSCAFASVTGQNHLPLNSGSLFWAKAASPSRASSLARARAIKFSTSTRASGERGWGRVRW